MGDLCDRVRFGVIDILDVDTLLGTAVTPWYIQGIFSVERKLGTWHSSLVEILQPSGHQGDTATAVGKLADESTTDDVEPRLMRLAQRTEKQRGSHSTALMDGQHAGMKIAKLVQFSATRAKTTATRDSAYFAPSQPLYVKLKNIFRKLRHVPKHTVVAQVMNQPTSSPPQKSV